MEQSEILNASATRSVDVVDRCIHGTHFLIDLSQNYLDEKCDLFELNETGCFIWSLLDGRTVGSIAQALYDAVGRTVPFNEIGQDVAAFVVQINALGFVEMGLWKS